MIINLIFGLVVLVSFIRYFLGLKKSFSKSELERYYLLILLFFLLTVIFAGLGIGLKNNFLLLLMQFFLTASLYFNLCWARLATSSVNEIHEKNGKIPFLIRPLLAKILCTLWLFQITCCILAGPYAFDHYLASDTEVLIKSFWLCLVALSSKVFTLATEVILIFEIALAVSQHDDTEGLEIKFAYLTLLVLISFSLLYFVVDTAGFLVYWLTGLGELWELCAKLTSIIDLGFFILLLFNNFDRVWLRFYKNWHNRQTVGYIEATKRLYLHAIELYPASYRRNILEFSGIKSNEWLLRQIIVSLSDIRMHLWRCEAQFRAISLCVPIEQICIVKKASFNQELEVWRNGLGSREQANHILASINLIPAGISIDVPKISKTSGIRNLAHYYSRLAKHLDFKTL